MTVAPTAVTGPGRRTGQRRISAMVSRENLAGWLMASPFVLGLVFWTVGPMLYSLYLSLTHWDLLTPPRWVGLDNYREMFASPETWISLKVTTTYALGAIPLGMALGLAVAMLLNTKVRGLSIWRTIYYLPAVLSGVAVSLLWQFIFSADFGVLNFLLGLVGIKGPAWLQQRAMGAPRHHHHEPVGCGRRHGHLPGRAPGCADRVI